MKDKIDLEKAIKYLKIMKDKDLCKQGYVYSNEAIETVLQALKDREKLIHKLDSGEDFTSEQVKFIEKKFIPKKKIENKIKELEKKKKYKAEPELLPYKNSLGMTPRHAVMTMLTIDEVINILKELLEED